MTVLTTIEDLSVAFRQGTSSVTALDGINLTIKNGEQLAIIGESGSGKSTLALTLAGLLPASARQTGTIDWPGGPPIPGRDIGMVFQDPSASLDPVLTIGEQVAEGAVAHLGLGWKAAGLRARDLLARVQLPDPDSLLRAYPHQLSGGQRQRVAIAAAIAAGPRLLIADEATSALDTIVQAEIVTLLRSLVAEEGMTLLFITHDIALASSLADRIAVFRQAKLVEIGAAADITRQPREPYTASLLGAHIDLTTPPLVGARA
ncbi:MAG: transporter ATP-binding protein [Devosia sp.]|uniref:ATP-binding cassette domain-containing protein n=1 Tax=Devosia sp. TaxID=1871048 RepID=UPI0026358E67|nr:ABC transporter ATP-binding protein [Devosia sp.]MDB5529590.1 transporter ATP-binding protein [Devosia sp.]